MTLIEANSVRKVYRLGRLEVPVLRGASLAVAEGECVAVLGTSGSGKSTLLHILGGLDRPDRNGAGGEVRFEGLSLHAMSQRELNQYRCASVGFVFQFYHLLPELNVLQNVLIASMVRWGRFAYLARRKGITRRAESILERFGLKGRLRHRPVELSGGERQRVAIARALVNEPKLLLADEPTGNLDQNTGRLLLDALMEARRERGLTMVLVTHDEATARRADRTVQLRDGIVV